MIAILEAVKAFCNLVPGWLWAIALAILIGRDAVIEISYSATHR